MFMVISYVHNGNACIVDHHFDAVMRMCKHLFLIDELDCIMQEDLLKSTASVSTSCLWATCMYDTPHVTLVLVNAHIEKGITFKHFC